MKNELAEYRSTTLSILREMFESELPKFCSEDLVEQMVKSAITRKENSFCLHITPKEINESKMINVFDLTRNLQEYAYESKLLFFRK